MREIKFRAWIFGGLDGHENPFMEKVSSIEYDDAGNVSIIRWTRWNEMSTMDECYLMQYTGLKDKDGKESYYDDIVKSPEDGKIGVIIWNPHFCAPMICPIDDYKKHKISRGNCEFLDRKTFDSNIGCEIIGNIYENPELLEGGDTK